MMKKLLACCLALVLLTGSAMAASLIGGSTATAGLPDQAKILSVTCGTNNVTGVLTDGKGNTVHRMTTAQAGSTMMISLGGASVSDIWVRIGDYTSGDAYDGYDLPTTMSVSIYTQSSGNASAATYHYAMDAAYAPYTVNENWHYGYQRMALPQKFGRVNYIALTVTSVRGGYYGNNLTAISDLMVTSGAGNTSVAPSAPQRTRGVLLMRLAARTGPSTNYTEPGSFHSKGYELDVISQAYDERNGIWWVQVEFEYKSEKMRAYTGVKRVDVDLQHVPVEEYLGSVRMTREVKNPWYGPGYNYRKHNKAIPNGMTCEIYAIENGWLLLEYYDETRSQFRRVWVPQEYTSY